ncbi:MAG: hypothetical protein CLLPBCKN_003964 [Chroococcidiopsis cubana SAG 39.79]|uniref:Galactose oxidase n=2 Tax=Chroococcidiopsis TaxID=54298 RepID=K9TXB3_CHRTP|nr:MULTISPECIES: galactose oxidase-like domain-containing protein [Chroococcidiopsis]PSB45733.1 DUF1929 domain-containing protein [Cyanosarcina cf. burmensis CCALA 770]AFY87215.1 Galactose oxidase [Chroococcidiopsis thermalis PCC 7203]MDZ4874568.1 hypothetical protein [Chroococcidiopsis cubana SAG 39.79]PSB61880.1 DUF1929 domain-containing protein [Chroococcidiopsis cubana CCALA 043]RUT10976.1 hypothetical protein DSM107010_37360 [Chroococcidiopsis cubana SAG 39.79]
MIQHELLNLPTKKFGTGTLIAQGSGVGSWQLLSYQVPINPVHAALLRTGKVFFFTGSGNNPTRINSPFNSVVWDVNSGTFTSQSPPTDPSGLPIDLFCAGQSFRADGRLMIAGGTLQYDPFYGATAAFLFDPSNEQLTAIASMKYGRWYPTVLTLGNGRIFALSGLDVNGNLAINPEIYSSSWRAFSQATSPFELYAHLILTATGQVFYTGGYFAFNNGVSARLLTLPGNFNQRITETPVGALQQPDSGAQAASVLLPPAQDQRVMVIGGGNPNQATNRVSIINLNATNPAYAAAPSLNFARKHHNAVILPDRTVLVCNGSGFDEAGNAATLTAEIYDPIANTWTLTAPANRVRLYHSVALLLPDGRVVTTGGNPRRLNECDSNGNLPGTPSLPCEDRQIEIYSPPYISQTRPTIQNAPAEISLGNTFTVTTPQAQNIQWVSLIRPMATTHGLDTEQRLVDLPIASRTSTSLSVTLTSNRNIAPAGWYMLFVSNNSRIPSVARWIRVR